MRLRIGLTSLLLLAACDQPPPARQHVVACHGQIMNSHLHTRDDIIEVAEHRQMLSCMAAKGFGFLSSSAGCVISMAQVDDPACYSTAPEPATEAATEAATEKVTVSPRQSPPADPD